MTNLASLTLIVGILIWLGSFPYFRLQLRSWQSAMGAWALALPICAISVFARFHELIQHRVQSVEIERNLALELFCRGLIPLLALPLVAKLYWVVTGGPLSEAEKKPGREGLRAWLGPMNLIACALIALCAWQGFEYDFWVVMLTSLGLLAAYPSFGALANQETKERTMEQDLGKERERILNLLEEGKITAEDSADLLQALTDGARASQPRPPRAIPLWHKWVLAGAALVVVSFFLPWLRVNLAKEMQRGMEKAGMGQMGEAFRKQMETVQKSMGDMPSGMPGNLQMSFPSTSSGAISIYAKNLNNGLGWLILFLALAGAAIPFFEGQLDASIRHKASFGALALGAILLAYVFLNSIRLIHFGILAAIAGYAVALGGGMKKLREGAHAQP